MDSLGTDTQQAEIEAGKGNGLLADKCSHQLLLVLFRTCFRIIQFGHIDDVNLRRWDRYL